MRWNRSAQTAAAIVSTLLLVGTFVAVSATRSGSWDLNVDPCAGLQNGRPEVVGYRLVTTKPERVWVQTTTFPMVSGDSGVSARIGTGKQPLRRNFYFQARCLDSTGAPLSRSYITRVYLGTFSTIYEEYDQ